MSSLRSQWAEILVAPRVEEVEGEPLVLIISDRYLNQAIGTCCTDNGHLFVSKHVKDLITRFAPTERPTMNAIPQERRRQFLDELAKITGRVLPPEEPIRAEAAFAEQDAKMFANGSALIRVEAVLADQDATLIANGL